MTVTTTVQAPHRLYGRGTQRRAVAALLDRLRTDSAVLVVTGEPGLGRTALLEHAARTFDTGRVLTVRADPALARTSCAAVHALCRSVAAVAAEAGAAVGAAGAPAQPVRALLDALACATVDAPLLVCVDDAHLWDAASRAALGAAARQLHRTGRVGLLVAVTGHQTAERDLAGLPVTGLHPLPPADAGALLDEVTGGGVDPAVRAELLDEAEGNPALLLALARRLAPAELAGERPLPRPLADAGTLTGVAGDVLRGLTPAAADLLLTAAAALRESDEVSVDADLVLRSARRSRPTASASRDPLPDAIGLADGRFRFAGSLLRRAAYAGATPERRRAAHRALAQVLAADGQRLPALLHRAWATGGPAPLIAEELSRAAADPAVPAPRRLRALAHGRAAQLTADAARRAASWTAAAEQALHAGRPRWALRLLDDTGYGTAPAAVRGRAELVRGLAERYDGPVADARESLLSAAALLTPTDPPLAATAALTAADAAWAAGDAGACLEALDAGWGVRGGAVEPGPAVGAAWAAGDAGAGLEALDAGLEASRAGRPAPGPAAEAAWVVGDAEVHPGALGGGRRVAGANPAADAACREVPGAGRSVPLPAADAGARPEAPGAGRSASVPVGPVDLAADYRHGMRAVLQGRFDLAAAPLRRVVAETSVSGEPEALLRPAVAALLLGDMSAAVRAGARALAAARAHGGDALVPRALEYLAYAELRAGRHALACTHAEEGLRAAQRAGQRNTAAHHHAVLALAASIVGEGSVVSSHVSAALSTARRHGLVQAATLAHWAAARADLGRGRPLEAADRLGPLVRPGPRRGHFAVWMLAVPCFVEAAVLAGRPDDAQGVLADLAVWASLGVDPQAPAQLARCRALLAPPEHADALYLRALDLHEAAVGDFERARTQLLYGKWLRRRRRLREARDRLGAALAGFDHCGAGVWAGQTRQELRANGAAPSGTGGGALSRLTPQQWRIAQCVAEGATNREVARTLSVSTRTVDYHLRNVFAVLGVRSRVELARLVEQSEKTGAQP
ncbi:LuxR C-terminal-related transcriptional regulator [Streptomyces sp. NPDC006997]|uniref:helix-turn-helix transcriptional regulator n=1 Tax=Streptomyces sp. NPDC006997 TaxID=3155356 RepID=UPI0033EA34C1